MKIIAQEVQCFNYDDEIKDDETIADSLKLDELMKSTNKFRYYFRPAEECPFGRGNWLVEFEDKNGGIVCFKYPAKLSEERFLRFIAPLIQRSKTETRAFN